MAKKKEVARTCEQCIHEWACQSWNVGSIHTMNATNCTNYETVKDSNAYFLGKREALCNVTPKDAKSMICTLDMFKRLAFNIHGVIDIVDDRNIEKMREILNQLND